ncbi:hypothetical protein [Adhaeribacter pallidiroseus]|uniref:Uncharacterized protein n=1 Tax=Adhaeribacter pallidiroseus TaxID=2072847 RepID=A0A369QF07_9BACT|nr:hypothetical protein [Adhaeribacter pallidiroseus]RDC63294.1 hypothetical protein AHMF7616_01896 [Adhaeribacter pallidiroseus]
MKFTDNEANQITGNRYGALIILWNAPDASETELDEIWEKTENIALDILSRMRKDRKEHRFFINLSQVQLDPVSTLFIDSDYGWRMEFSLDKPINICYNPANWTTV